MLTLWSNPVNRLVYVTRSIGDTFTVFHIATQAQLAEWRRIDLP